MNNEVKDKNSFVVGLIIIFALLFFCAGLGICHGFLPVVTLKVDNVTIRQDETVPEFNVYAQYSGKRNRILDKESGYTIHDLVNELNRGNGYQLHYDIDSTVEGVYSLELELDKSLMEKLNDLWRFKVHYQIENGKFEVLNKHGNWEDKRFTFLDGTKALGWTNIGDETYFFDEAGMRVEGEREIFGVTYYFDESGKFLKDSNRINPAKPMIAITFDDGPGPYTMQLLNQLEKYHSRATFFMVGTNVGWYPDTVKKMKEIGCELGNHTTTHARLTELDAAGVQVQIETTNQAIKKIVGESASLVRPPYGSVNEVVQASSGLPLAMWSVDTKDWELKNAELIKNYVLSTAKDGEIILLHDIHVTTVEAMLHAIPELVNRGFQLVTVSEMAATRGITLENGVKYYEFRKK